MAAEKSRPSENKGVERRDFIRRVVAGAAATSLLRSALGKECCCDGDPQGVKPAERKSASSRYRLPAPYILNILYIHSHDTGRYLRPYGYYEVATPHLQRLAEEGVPFRQAFSAAPTCSPSRASLLTGSYPHNNGMLGLAHIGFYLNDYGQHVLHTMLNGRGYYSALIGVQHIVNGTQVDKIRYDKVVEWKGVCCPRVELMAPAAVDFLNNLKMIPPPRAPYTPT